MVQVKARFDEADPDVQTSVLGRLHGWDVPMTRRMIHNLASDLADFLNAVNSAEELPPVGMSCADRDTGCTVSTRDTNSRNLSARQVEILCLVAAGMANKEIADQLDVSSQTIKNHMTHILDKLEANDRTHAVVLAHRLGMLNLE